MAELELTLRSEKTDKDFVLRYFWNVCHDTIDVGHDMPLKFVLEVCT